MCWYLWTSRAGARRESKGPWLFNSCKGQLALRHGGGTLSADTSCDAAAVPAPASVALGKDPELAGGNRFLNAAATL